MSWTRYRPFTRATVAAAPEFPGVYQIAAARGTFQYLLGKSSTLYYGKADVRVFDRLYKHFNGRGNKTVFKLLEGEFPLKVRWQHVDWDEPEDVECELITTFEEKFGEHPHQSLRS